MGTQRKFSPVTWLLETLEAENIRRDKDLPHTIHIRNLLRCRRALKRPTSKKAAKS
jgi:hypothetical protein